MKYNLGTAYFEITRKCNSHCAHCMRGPAQTIEMSKEDVDTFFDKLNGGSINRVYFGGGEPTLNPEMIEYIIDKIIRERLDVWSIEMITNGKVFDQRVTDAFNRFEKYDKSRCIYSKKPNAVNGSVAIYFSADHYHEPISPEVRKKYKKSCPLVYFGDHFVSDEDIIKTGFATFGNPYTYRLYNPNYNVVSNFQTNIYGMTYLTARGEVTTNGEGEYQTVDMNNYGHISNFDFYNYLVKYGTPYNNSPRIEDIMGEPRRMTQKGVNN